MRSRESFPFPRVVVLTRSALALIASVAVLSSARAQELVPDRALEIELKADDPLLEGHGPSRTFEYDVTFDGEVYVWASSKDFDPILRITSQDGELLAEDDDSGGGTTAFIRLDVSRNELPSITVASADVGSLGKFLVHASELPQSDYAGLALEHDLILSSNADCTAGDYGSARAKASEAVTRLLARPPAEQGTVWLDLLDFAGKAAYDAHDEDAAVSAGRRVLEIRSRALPDDHRDLQQIRGNLSAALQVLEDFAGARALQEKVLEVRSRTLPQDDPDLQLARLNLAGTLVAMGDLAGARALDEKALEVFSRTRPDDDPALQTARSNLAATIGELGDISGARPLQEKVLEVLSRKLPEDHRDLQVARQNLAVTIKQLGDFAGARALEQKVLEVLSRTFTDDHPRLQTARMYLAMTLFESGDLRGARELEENVLEVFSRTLSDEQLDLQLARLNLSNTLAAMGDLARARALQERVLENFSRTLPDEHPDVQPARRNLAVTIAKELERQRHSSEGTTEWEAGRERCAELIGTSSRMLAHAACAAIIGSSAREAEERCANLAKRLDLSLSFALGFGVFEPLSKLDSPSFVLAETTRGGSIASVELVRRAASSPRYGELREALRAASETLARLTAKGTTSEEFDRARLEREGVERELMHLAREVSGGSAAEIEAEPLAERLDEDEAAIGFRRFTNRRVEVAAELDSSGRPALRETTVASLCAFVVLSSKHGTQASTLKLIDLGPMEPIESAVRAWRDAIGVGLERGIAVSESRIDRVRASGEQLRELVLDPLLPALGAADHLVVALDDVLQLVPLDALPLADSKDPVGERWRIETRATLSELMTHSPEPTGTALVALGGASFNTPPLALADEGVASIEEKGPVKIAGVLRGSAWERGFAPLTYSGDEARGIGALYAESFVGERPALVLEKRKASREALEELAPQARFVHIATHGWFAPESIRSWTDPEPLDRYTGLGSRLSGEEQVRGMSPMLLCGLALAGANLPENELGRAPGLITADELSTLDLSNCELAVLSACDTNVGEMHRAGQGVHSLQMALQMAGARSVITSLWKVPDEATKVLMLDFYRRLWVEKKPKGQALWEAKRKLREREDERGLPLYTTRDWAAWVLTGDPN